MLIKKIMNILYSTNKSIVDLCSSIKSIYILKHIFSYLFINKKLDIIKYNKSIQNKFKIDIEYYKKISGRYIIGDRNGNGREYTLNEHKLIFKGNYLNGRRNKGKELFRSHIIRFEGEYINGKRWNGKVYDIKSNVSYEIKQGKGKGKDYDFNGELIFEGEYLNGERNGKGKEYADNKLIFEGEYLYGLRNGKGKEYKGNKLIFEGEYLNDKRHGKGKEYADNKLIFEGEYLNGIKWNGAFYDINGNIIYEIKKGKGKGKEYDFYGKLQFEGEYLNGKRNGKGKEYDFNGKLIFEG